MKTTRVGATATLLANGKVLLAGGSKDNRLSIATAELYDPATGTFDSTGSMKTDRMYHTATLLPDGRVLIAGGDQTYLPECQGCSAVAVMDRFLASAELYDPKSGKFSPAGSMKAARSGHTATPLSDGRVLLAGGTGDGTTALYTAELYDPTTGTFAPTGSMAVGRWHCAAALLPDGRVLILGGTGNTLATLATAELYDPASGTFVPAGSMASARQDFAAVPLSDGRVLAAGGSDGSSPLASAELFAP
jgi:hypothetical protein